MKHIEMRDLTAGLLLASLGIFVVVYARSHYTVGKAVNMGPGYFPMMLGWVLAALGVVIAILAFRKTIHALHPPKLEIAPLLAVLAAIAAFGLLVQRFGLVPGTLALTFLAALAERPYRLGRTIALAVALALMSWLIFTIGLQMTLPAWNWGA